MSFQTCLKAIILLNLITVSSFASSVFTETYKLSKISKNWEDRTSCENFIGYHPPKCMDEGVTCTEFIVNVNQVGYNVCSEYQTVIEYATDADSTVYTQAKCVSKGFSFEQKYAQLKVFDNSNNSYYGTTPVIFMGEFNSEESCMDFVKNLNNSDSVNNVIEINFKDNTFITK